MMTQEPQETDTATQAASTGGATPAASSGESIIEVRHLSKAFGTNQVLLDIDFQVHPGDVHYRCVGIGEIHAAAMHQPVGDRVQRRDFVSRQVDF